MGGGRDVLACGRVGGWRESGRTSTKGTGMAIWTKKMVAALAAAGLAMACTWSGRSVEVDGKTLPLVFEDGSVKGREADRIAGDYRRMVELEGDDEWKKINGETRAGRSVRRILHLHPFGKDCILSQENNSDEPLWMTWRKSGLWEFGWLVDDGDGRKAVVVPRRVSDGYRKVFQFLEGHREALDLLPAYLRELDALCEETLPEDMADFICCDRKLEKSFFRDLQNMTPERRAMVLAEYAGCHYELGPLLAVGENDGRLIVILSRTRIDGTDHPLPMWGFAFDQGRWKSYWPAGLE